MDIRTAILKAADWIWSNPALFDFGRVDIPDCGTPGCALGWIGFHAGIVPVDVGGSKPFRSVSMVAAAGGSCVFGIKTLMDIDPVTFYRRMREIDWRWSGRSDHCALAMRKYADKYHPAATPDWEALAKPGGKTFEPSCAST